MAKKTKKTDEPKAQVKKPGTRVRSAESGRFVNKEAAKTAPVTTVTEKVKPRPRRAAPKRKPEAAEATRRDLVQTSLNERNVTPDHANDRLFERIHEVDPTV